MHLKEEKESAQTMPAPNKDRHKKNEVDMYIKETANRNEY